jgi:predicted nucleic acid-binding protein
MPGSFFDTNVVLYIASADPAKTSEAEKLIGTGGVISVQVLNEITNLARRKMGMSWPEIRAFLSLIRDLLSVEPITHDIHETGVALAERYGFSGFDAMIVASPLRAGCDTLWSEDMQDGTVIGKGLQIVNPFRAFH